MSLKRQVARLAASGMGGTEIAAKLHVTPGYISQLEQDDDYKRLYQEMVSQQQVATHGVTTKIDNCYNTLELMFAETLVENAEVVMAAMISSPKHINEFLRTLNGAKRRGVGEGANGLNPATVVQLQLPTFFLNQSTPQVKHNQNNEVIEVDGRSLVSLSGTGVRSQLSQLQTAKLPAPRGKVAAGLAKLQEQNAELDLDNM